jgi:PBSX family phage terminase large subunit
VTTLARGPLQHRYVPRGTARTMFESRADEILVAGPAGTGKSRGIMEKLHMLALLNPRMRGLIVRKTLASLGSTALVTWREHVAVEALAAGQVVFYGGSPQESPQYRYPNGSTIVVGGMDRSTRIMSSEYDVVYIQEATELSENDWEALLTRLRNWKISFQQILADANPDMPTHWLKQRCDKGKTMMLESRHEENPRLFDDAGKITPGGAAYMAKLDSLTGVRYQRLRRGLWVAAEGIVYGDFDPAVHVVDRYDVPAEWPRFWSVDFGYTNPFVCQMWAQKPDGELVMYREVYHTKRTVDIHAVTIMDAVSRLDPTYRHPLGQPRYAYHGRIWTEPKPRAIICDHDAGDRAMLSRETGLGTVAAMKAVTDGIQATEIRFRDRRLTLMRDSVVERDPELVDAKRPVCTIEEIPGYIWDAGTGKAPKETPVKDNDHGCDGMRYFVAYVDEAVKPRVRFM